MDGIGLTYEDDGEFPAGITFEAYMVAGGDLRTGWVVEVASCAFGMISLSLG